MILLAYAEDVIRILGRSCVEFLPVGRVVAYLSNSYTRTVAVTTVQIAEVKVLALVHH